MENKKINLEIFRKIMQHPRLGEILIQHKKASIGQVGDAMKIQAEKKIPIGEVLIQMGIITENELIEVLELQTNIDKMLSESFNEIEKLNNNEVLSE